MKLQHTKKSYIQVICFGAIIGLITELLNLFPNDDVDGEILELEGDEAVYEEIDIASLKTVPEVIHALQDYYESKGGTWKNE